LSNPNQEKIGEKIQTQIPEGGLIRTSLPPRRKMGLFPVEEKDPFFLSDRGLPRQDRKIKMGPEPAGMNCEPAG
jgi:hypothetical protein